jgi:hypothetical protein
LITLEQHINLDRGQITLTMMFLREYYPHLEKLGNETKVFLKLWGIFIRIRMLIYPGSPVEVLPHAIHVVPQCRIHSKKIILKNAIFVYIFL